LNNGEPSNFVAYYDATSLYPSSGEFVKAKRGGGGGRGKEKEIPTRTVNLPSPPQNLSPPLSLPHPP